jgi:hypothetical protein
VRDERRPAGALALSRARDAALLLAGGVALEAEARARSVAPGDTVTVAVTAHNRGERRSWSRSRAARSA